MKEHDKYNKLIQDKLDGFEFEYDAADWTSLSKKLPKKGFPSYLKIASIFAGAVIIAAGAFYLSNDKNIEEIQSPQTEQATPIFEADENKPTLSEIGSDSISQEKEDLTSHDFKQNKPKRFNQDIAEQDKASAEQVINSEEKLDNILNQNQKKISSVNENKKRSIKLRIEKSVYCINDLIKIQTSQPLNSHFSFKVNNKSLTTSEFIPEVEGDYKIELLEDGLIVDSKAITIASKPKSNFIASKKSEEFAKITYNFESETNDEFKYEWRINGEVVSNKPDFNKHFRRSEKIEVKLATENASGCKSNTLKTIQIEEDFDIYSYDAFTPNGDGINDEFIPKAIEANNLKFEMMIYSLSGQLLYSTTDFSKPWNGRRNNDGELMPVGTYLWKVNLYDDNNEIHPHNGQIKIVNFK